ncbi:MAG: RNA polymerase sigma factor [Sphingobacteriales bacterium]
MTGLDALSDHELTELLRQDDARAFSCIYDRYWKDTYQVCYNRLRDRGQCQDIVQNIFTALWDRRTQVDIKDLQAYLHTAVKFQVLRLAQRATRIEFIGTFEQLITEPTEKGDLIAEREILRLLQLFIAALPEKRRVIFIKRYTQNYSTAEIAEELGISRKTVLNQLNNAETILRARLSHLVTISILVGYWLKNQL